MLVTVIMHQSRNTYNEWNSTSERSVDVVEVTLLACAKVSIVSTGLHTDHSLRSATVRLVEKSAFLLCNRLVFLLKLTRDASMLTFPLEGDLYELIVLEVAASKL